MKIRASIKKMTRFWGIALCVVLAAAIMVLALTSCKEPQPDSPAYEVLSLLKEKNYIHAKNLYNEKISGNEKEERLMEVLLEEYIVTEKGGEQGDFGVQMYWKEWKTAKSIRYSIKKQDGGNAMIEQGQKRQAKTPAVTYTVKKGDCLWNIAKRELGDGTKYKEIARKNGISDPNRIYPGQVLKL
jgi:hypothetical protein